MWSGRTRPLRQCGLYKKGFHVQIGLEVTALPMLFLLPPLASHNFPLKDQREYRKVKAKTPHNKN